MRLRLGINTCFAVKRWPMPDDWAPIVREQLGLRLVQHSLDLVDLHVSSERLEAQADQLRDAVAAHDLSLHSTFTGLAAYSANLLLAPDAADRDAARGVVPDRDRVHCPISGSGDRRTRGCFSVPDWQDPARHAELWTGLQGTLAGLAADARTAGIDYLVVENLAVEREPSTMALIRELLDDGDADRVPIRLCLESATCACPARR